MDIGELIRMCLRRWLILIPAFLIVGVATVGAYEATPTKYQSQVQLTMLNSEKVTNEMGDLGNPYLSFSQALSVDVDLLTRLLVSDSSIRQLAARGVTEPFTATFANNALGPFMLITVTGPNRAHVLQSINTLVSFAQQRWYALQKASFAPPASIVRLSLIAPPSTPSPVLKTKIELVGAVAIAGIVIALLLAVIVDKARGGRQRQQPWRADDRSERAARVPSMR
jgi:uncharacterized protein involved in exopolysaccharide biosynthesis